MLLPCGSDYSFSFHSAYCSLCVGISLGLFLDLSLLYLIFLGDVEDVSELIALKAVKTDFIKALQLALRNDVSVKVGLHV